MNSTYGQCSLFLCPDKNTSSANLESKDITQLVTELQAIGFISRPINNSGTSTDFFTGDSFLDHIAYMGCSPAIQFEPSATNSNFCHIKIHLYNEAQLIASKKQSRAPHCPNCMLPAKNWIDNKTPTQIFCDQCNTTSNIEKFNWRKMAGYAQIFIEITDIFPKEAIPQSLLLDKLSDIFDTNWLYFYSCK